MKRIQLGVGLLVLSIMSAIPAFAMNLFFSTGVDGVAVTSVNDYRSFTDNQTNGTGAAFSARYVTVHSHGSTETNPSANTCVFHLNGTTATATKDIGVAPGGTFSFEWDPVNGGDGWTSIAFICKATETAYFDIVASR